MNTKLILSIIEGGLTTAALVLLFYKCEIDGKKGTDILVNILLVVMLVAILVVLTAIFAVIIYGIFGGSIHVS